jgi:hypothetical protein
MKIQKSKSKFDCLPAAFAIACDTDIDEFKKILGINGEAIQWPSRVPPYRGWHYEECMWAASKLGFVSMPIHHHSYLGYDSGDCLIIKPILDLSNHDRYVLIKNKHAVASDGKSIFDPKGEIYPINELEIYSIIIGLYTKSNQKCFWSYQ